MTGTGFPQFPLDGTAELPQSVGMEFEWDEKKAASNVVKHSVSFESAVEVFSEDVYIAPTIRVVDGEDRYKAVGSVAAKLYAVVYVDIGAVRRLISARRTNRKEDRAYADHQIQARPR